MLRRSLPFCLMFAALLAGCGEQGDGALDVAVIGSRDSVFAGGQRLSGGAQLVRSAQDSGLVALGADGAVVPALAETWIVTDDGLSFIFRLRQGDWPDGSALTAESARTALLAAIEGLEGTSMALDLAPVAEVRAMAGRVIEIRLDHPEPYLLQLLAQPELALQNPGGGTGPMTMEAVEDGWRFAFRPPDQRGLPMTEDWQEDVVPIDLTVTDAESAIALFDSGEVDVVLGGDLGNLPLVDTGPLSSGTLRIDATFGLFGLQVRGGEGLLSDPGVREGVAMAIDREALIASYNVGGWIATTRPVSPGLPGDPGMVAERWTGASIESRRALAAGRIAAWRRANGADAAGPIPLTLYLDRGPGWDRLLRGLAEQLAQVGIALRRADSARGADMVFVDRVARFPAPRWYLNQFNCRLARGLCSEEVDTLVSEAVRQADPAARALLMAQAEARLTLANVYIPIGAPLRWSLARGSVDGFVPNAYAFHPLPPLGELPS